jgi:23S rRNA pseudouridine955/2504/2580 synthase
MTDYKQYNITRDDDGMRLDRWCNRELGAPVSLLNKAFRKGLIRINGKKCEGKTRVQKGQLVEVRMDVQVVPTIPSVKKTVPMHAGWVKKITAAVLFRDRDIIIINKPAGLATQGGSKVKIHLDGLLPALQFDAAEPPRLVHRLDKDTSGIMVLARSAKVARELQKHFVQKTMEKTYLALVAGVPKPHAGEISSRMEKIQVSDDGFERVAASETGKIAVTTYQVRDYMAKTAALVELQPHTGRTHQLRVHMAEKDCPILGDGKYGMRTPHLSGLEIAAGLHLHAWRLTLPELFNKPSRTFEAPLPPAFMQSLHALGLSHDRG